MSTVNVQLQLVKDTGRYLVAHQGGPDFWFDKETLPGWRVEGDELFVEITEKAWTRRQRAVREVEPPVETKVRKCLCCSKPFAAEKNQYVCAPCKRTEIWHAGGTVFTA